MKKFSTFIKEAVSDMQIKAITSAEQKKFDKAIAPYTYTIKSSTGKTTTVTVRAPKDDRASVKTDLENKLRLGKFTFQAKRGGGSTGSTAVLIGAHTIAIEYKPLSGGMSETTLNSTITELAPALAFMANKHFSDVKKFYAFLETTIGKRSTVYVNDHDKKSGEEFIKSMPTSSKFNEKMENAIAVLNYLWDLHKKSPVSNVYWGYRAKPEGIAASHKGDLFAQFESGEMLGISLKAGGEKTHEPQLNTYVNKFYDDIGNEADKQKLIDEVHKKIHSKLGLPKNWADRGNKAKSLDVFAEFIKRDPMEYDRLYDQMLEIVRTSIINAVNANMKDTIAYIKKQVIKKDESVPLVVVKAFGKEYKMITDENAIETFLPTVKKIVASKSTSSKQAWAINLISKNGTITMNMTVRTNKPAPDNKLAQGYNLAIKFNGITHS
jgi:hypothetical protein